MPSFRFSAAVFLLGLFAIGPASPSAVGASGDADRAVAEKIRARIEQMQPAAPIEVGRSRLAARKALPMLYEDGGYQPFWNAERLRTLVEVVRESAQDGLQPEDYHLSELEKAVPSLAGPGGDAESRAQADLLATDAFFLLLYHLYLGKVDPKSLDSNWNFEPRPVGESQGLAFVLDALKKGQLREA